MENLSTTPNSRFTVSPCNLDVFTFPSPELEMDSSQASTSFVKNPLFDSESPTFPPADAEPTTPLPKRPSKLFLANHQEDLFDIQVDECIKESQGNGRYNEWDKAGTAPENDRDQIFSEWPIQLLKVIVYNVIFVLILVLAVSSKCITLLMTSMIYVNRTIPLCLDEQTKQTILPPMKHNVTYTLEYGENSVHRIAWLWCLYFATITPYVFAFGRSVRICCFKKFSIPQGKTVVTVFLMETLHIAGLAMLLFVILPNFDVVRGAMMLSSVCTVPSFIRLFVVPKLPTPLGENNKPEVKSIAKRLGLTNERLLAWFTFALQLISLAAWTVMDHYEAITGNFHLLPLCLILVSFEWWENYLVPGQMWRIMVHLDDARKDLQEGSRYFVTLFVAPWKCLLLFLLMLLQEFVFYGDGAVKTMFHNFSDGFHTDSIPLINGSETVPVFGPFINDDDFRYIVDTDPLIPLYFLLAHVCINYACYWLAKYACQIWIQKVSFAVPITLTIPATVAILWEFTKLAQSDKCSLVHRFPMFQHIFWYGHLDGTFIFDDDINGDWLYIGVSAIWFLGTQFANTTHIWRVNHERLATSDQLFVSPKYNSVLIDQSLALNRRCLKVAFTGDEKENEKEGESQGFPYLGRRQTRAEIEHAEFLARQIKQEEDWANEWTAICAEHGLDEDAIDPKPNPADDDTIRIYACATMWHEDKNEMLQMLKSVMRLDFDQGVKRIAKESYNETDEYYELETNIFFDNAFEQGPTDAKDDRVINGFVEQLIELMNDAATQVLGTGKVFVDYPTIVPTPFGGKLVWKLPGGNRLITHIKDKQLIRDRKRWSQCMYMYFLLGHRLEARKDLNWLRKQRIANNSFILALDGDINFQPEAVGLVLDLMKKQNKLGAACGRIHPIGSGLMVWYQKFEYGIGHWFQKATEHVFGCVLCSPGCFSLFRARALMDDNVMRKYATRSSEALHYVQYDQGEDRWLCTLLLQRGWRIEYCAASDSYTHAPEGFAEFYTQRRRWAPSTMANILDLLSNWRQTVGCNENISRLYILYQLFLLVGSLLSPATITLMVVTAMNTALNMHLNAAITINIIVICVFTFVCYYLDNSKNLTKINCAVILSTIYALLMLAVLVGTAMEMVEQGIFSPNSLFFTAMIGSFLLAALIHPHEFACVFLFPIYMLLIPSMYLLLTIYSVTNMHIVSWGTREVKVKSPTSEERAGEEATAKLTKRSKARELLQYLDPRKYGSGRIFDCMCCSTGSSDASGHGMLNCVCCSGAAASAGVSQKATSNEMQLQQLQANVEQMQTVVSQLQSQIPEMIYQSLVEPSPRTRGKTVEFQEPHILRSPRTPRISLSESEFLPESTIDEEEEEEEEEEHTPKWILNHPKLRTFKRKDLHPRERQFWEDLIAKYLYPIQPDRKEQQKIESELLSLRNKALFATGFLNVLVVLLFFILQAKDALRMVIPLGSQKIEMHPVGFWLVLFFGSLLLIQCTGMMLHRFGTITQLLSYTPVSFWTKKKQTMANLVKKVIFLNAIESKMHSNEDSEPSTIRETVDEEKARRKTPSIKLDDLFKKQIKMLHREASHLSDPNSRIDANEFSRLSIKRPTSNGMTLPPPPQSTLNDVVVEGTSDGQTLPKVPFTATRSLKIRSKQYLDRFTGSIRQLRSRAWSAISREMASDA